MPQLFDLKMKRRSVYDAIDEIDQMCERLFWRRHATFARSFRCYMGRGPDNPIDLDVRFEKKLIPAHLPIDLSSDAAPLDEPLLEAFAPVEVFSSQEDDTQPGKISDDEVIDDTDSVIGASAVAGVCGVSGGAASGGGEHRGGATSGGIRGGDSVGGNCDVSGGHKGGSTSGGAASGGASSGGAGSGRGGSGDGGRRGGATSGVGGMCGVCGGHRGGSVSGGAALAGAISGGAGMGRGGGGRGHSVGAMAASGVGGVCGGGGGGHSGDAVSLAGGGGPSSGDGSSLEHGGKPGKGSSSGHKRPLAAGSSGGGGGGGGDGVGLGGAVSPADAGSGWRLRPNLSNPEPPSTLCKKARGRDDAASDTITEADSSASACTASEN